MTQQTEKRFDIFDMAAKLAELPSLMVYPGLLAHMIKDSIPLQMQDGHCFKIERKDWINGVHTLTATDSYDGKRYTITIEPERK